MIFDMNLNLSSLFHEEVFLHAGEVSDQVPVLNQQL